MNQPCRDKNDKTIMYWVTSNIAGDIPLEEGLEVVHSIIIVFNGEGARGEGVTLGMVPRYREYNARALNKHPKTTHQKILIWRVKCPTIL